MLAAFVFISTELGEEKNLLKQLRSISNVKEAHIVYGVYDIVVKVEAETMDKLKEIVALKIRSLSDVRSTTTMTVAEGIWKHLHNVRYIPK
ncbi:MAG: Lrp/AsnC ligand binding domain-containing protein [Candidatus Bathyarchaeota archaeon]|nr:Lrp/AsnC ligand binding domain-containing protein [Candidatus Bathyarchaeota archaeon]